MQNYLPTIIFFLALATSLFMLFGMVIDVIKENRIDPTAYILAMIPCALWSWLFYLLH